MRKIEKISFVFILAVFGLSQSACLKTRAQVKDDGQAEEIASPPPQPATRYEVEEIKHEITRLSGKLDELEHQQNSSDTDDLKKTITQLEAKIAELEKSQTALQTELKEVKEKGHNSKGTPGNGNTNVDGLLKSGHKLLKEKKYAEAADKFRTAVERNPKAPDTAEAHFGLGEAEFALKNYKKAIVEYSKVQETFSKSHRVPTSLYKIGVSFQSLNMGKEARGFFAEIVDRYPKSAEAKKAKAKLKD